MVVVVMVVVVMVVMVLVVVVKVMVVVMVMLVVVLSGALGQCKKGRVKREVNVRVKSLRVGVGVK